MNSLNFEIAMAHSCIRQRPAQPAAGFLSRLLQGKDDHDVLGLPARRRGRQSRCGSPPNSLENTFRATRT